MSLCELRMLSHLSAEPEVSEFDVIRLVNEDICRLDVSMKDLASSSFLIRCSIVAVLQCQK